MPKSCQLVASVAIVTALLLPSSLAAARNGQAHGHGGFDDIWVGTPEADAFTAVDGDRDKLFGRVGDDTLDAGDMRDFVRAGGGGDTVLAGPGRDKVFGNAGDDTLDGGDDGDLVRGGTGDDSVAGGEGHDLVLGQAGDDVLEGGSGHDRVRGGTGDDRTAGGPGNLDITGGPGNDDITGGPGNDRLRGGDGDDIIDVADDEVDWVACGPGTDSVTADVDDIVADSCESSTTS